MTQGGLVDAHQLHERLNDRGTRILHASLGAANGEHIPGARIFDLNAAADPSSDLAHTLPDARHFAAVAAAVQARPEDAIVIYDSGGMATAARAWWMFKVFGYPDVRVLNGGLPAWKAAGHATQEGPQAVPGETPPLSLQQDAARFADFEAVARASRLRLTIADARPAARFLGQAPEPRPGVPGGHIPNSTNLPYTELLDASGHLLPAAALRAKFIAAGIDSAAPLICTCGSGVTACVLALALQELGNGSVRVYDGSWSEWAQHLPSQEN